MLSKNIFNIKKVDSPMYPVLRTGTSQGNLTLLYTKKSNDFFYTINKTLYILAIVLLSIIFIFLFQKESNAAYSEKFKNYPGYEELIKTLQEKHPKWEFEILETGLDWSEVITAEHGKNAVSSSRGSAWKCTCNNVIEPGWVCASTAAISYYMDPRNSINEDYIFQFEQLTYDSNIQIKAGVETILSDCNYMQGNITYYDASGNKKTINKTYADVIMEVAKEYNISPYHLASRIRQEQGAGDATPIISGTYKNYEGLYNYFNVKAFGSTTTAIIENGLTWARNKGWTNPELAIKGGAAVIANDYTSCGQDTLYLQKFDVVDGGDGYYYWQYMTNVSASKTEGYEIRDAYEEMGMINTTSTIKFKIPVYKNMPAQKASEPGMESIVTQDVEINANSVDVKEGKGASYKTIDTLNKGTKILRIELDNQKDSNEKYWDKVVLANGTKGYVSREYLTELTIQSNCNEAYVVSAYTNFRNGPGISGTTIIKLLSPGQLLTVVEKGKYESLNGEAWYRVKISDGTYGYVGTGYIEKYDPVTSEIDTVKVVCSDGLYIRKEPTTQSDNIIKAVAQGTILTRTKKDVESTDTKYTWDKITTSDGIIGYVVREDPTTKKAWISPVTTTTTTTTIQGTGFKSEVTNLITQPNITVANIKKVASDAVIKNGNTVITDNNNVGTGYTITTEGKTYTIIVLGDVNGDGKVNTGDTLILRQHVENYKKVTNTNYLEASDINKDGKINTGDTLILRQHVEKFKTINI